MENYIIAAILVVIIGLALGYVIRAKKSGKKCIGCPDSGSENCCCGCQNKKK
ncbi:MAG: hypothetical protein IJ407_03070 [Clostridia bacterium]|nr:hypothetical protein [Clostridia bacterium]